MFLPQPTPRRTATNLDQRTHVVECCDRTVARHHWFGEPTSFMGNPHAVCRSARQLVDECDGLRRGGHLHHRWMPRTHLAEPSEPNDRTSHSRPARRIRSASDLRRVVHRRRPCRLADRQQRRRTGPRGSVGWRIRGPCHLIRRR